MRIAVALVCALQLLAGVFPSHAAATDERPLEPHDARFTFELGTSSDLPHNPASDPAGYDYFDARNSEHGAAVAIGLEPNHRIFGFIASALMIGFESYPRGATREVPAYGGSVATLQMGAKRKSSITIASDMRILIGPWHRKEAFLDLGMGWTWVHGDPREDRRADTREVIQTYPGAKFSGLLFEAGAGVRTHNPIGFDWMVGVRARGYTDILNAAQSYLSGETKGGNNTNGGSTTQLYIGVVTPRSR